MKFYNGTNAVQTFYGVEFQPGDIKDVPGYISAQGFFPVNDITPMEFETESKEVEQVVNEPLEDKVEKSTKGRKSKESEN